MGDDFESQMSRKGEQIESALQAIEDTMSASAVRTKEKLEQFQDLVVGKYKQYHKPRKIVFFAEDARGQAKAASDRRQAVAAADRVVPVEIKATLLAEETLEHRGLRQLWRLALDGSGVRYADIDGGYLYLTTKRNLMYSVDMATGLTRWVYNLAARPDTPPGFGDEYVVISAGDTIKVIDKLVGKAKWQFRTDIQPASRPYCASEHFLFGCWTGNVAGFRFGERFPRWQYKAGSRVFSAPLLGGEFAYSVDDDGKLVKYNTVLRLVSKELPLGGRPVGDPALTKDTLYVGTERFEMISVRFTTMIKTWEHGCGGRVRAGPWLFNSPAGTILYYSAHNDGLYALTAMTGKKRWHLAGGLKPVAVSGEHVFVLKEDGTLCKINNGTGAVVWSEPIAPFTTAVGQVGQGTIFLVSADGQVFAVASKP